MILKDITDNLLELSDFGRRLGRKPGEQHKIFREISILIPPYFTVLEWAYYQKIRELSNVETIVHWNEHSSEDVSSENTTASYQAACFFRFCEGAWLGDMRIGRKGKPTRLILKFDELTELITKSAGETSSSKAIKGETNQQTKIPPKVDTNPTVVDSTQKRSSPPTHSEELYKRVYITHGKNVDLIDTLKSLLNYGDLEPVVSVQTQSVSKPIPEK